MGFKTAKEIKDYLWQEFGLADRAITFSIVDAGGDNLYFESGIIDNSGDLWESDALTQIGTIYCDDEMLDINSVEAYMIGDGEADHADLEELEAMQDIADEYPDLFDAFIQEYAEPMVSMKDIEIENPEFDGEEEQYDY